MDDFPISIYKSKFTSSYIINFKALSSSNKSTHPRTQTSTHNHPQLPPHNSPVKQIVVEAHIKAQIFCVQSPALPIGCVHGEPRRRLAIVTVLHHSPEEGHGSWTAAIGSVIVVPWVAFMEGEGHHAILWSVGELNFNQLAELRCFGIFQSCLWSQSRKES